ncbi:uncharacterized protein LOC117642943 [Thrips palmi]|uniref:Uncharacterized protein LOC117642943 n=1 Tax=Thrips palmi TaxID=161013 RepID=A0A6P8ZKP7_THRPL|nr:uncharacterized protein LOC117642943 [Thrips palmi]
MTQKIEHELSNRLHYTVLIVHARNSTYSVLLLGSAGFTPAAPNRATATRQEGSGGKGRPSTSSKALPQDTQGPSAASGSSKGSKTPTSTPLGSKAATKKGPEKQKSGRGARFKLSSVIKASSNFRAPQTYRCPYCLFLETQRSKAVKHIQDNHGQAIQRERYGMDGVQVRLENNSCRGVRVLCKGVFKAHTRRLKPRMSKETFKFTLDVIKCLLLEALVIIGEADVYEELKVDVLRSAYSKLLEVCGIYEEEEDSSDEEDAQHVGDDGDDAEVHGSGDEQQASDEEVSSDDEPGSEELSEEESESDD